MTFRSFSRFVRWYRWELAGGTLVSCLGPAFLSETAPRVTWAASACFVAALIGAGRRWEYGHPFRVCNRYLGKRRRHLRSQPLRGWTK